MAANDPITITKSQIQYLAELILDAANQQTVTRMVTSIDHNSDDYHVPTAKAVNSKIGDVRKYVSLVIASGDPSEANIQPDEETMYMVRTSANSSEFVPYLWTAEAGYITMPSMEAATSSGRPEAITYDEIATAVANAATSVVVIPSASEDPEDPEDPTDPSDTPDPTTDPDSGEGGDDTGSDDDQNPDSEPGSGDTPTGG